MDIHKFDLLYAVAKVCSFQSIEHIGKHAKLESSKGQKANSSKDNNESSSAQKRQKSNLIEYFERYLNYPDYFESGYDPIFENCNLKLREHLPITKLNTLKDRNNIIVVFIVFFKKVRLI